MHCTGGGNCEQGKRECSTPTACGSEVIGGTYWPLLAESKPIEYAGEEPMSDLAKAIWTATAIAIVLLAAIAAWDALNG